MSINNSRNAGFTLVEVLVSLAVLVFGLLGLAGLISKGHRAAFEAYQRHQALAVVGYRRAHPRQPVERASAAMPGTVRRCRTSGSNLQLRQPRHPQRQHPDRQQLCRQRHVAAPLGNGTLLAQLGQVAGIKDCREERCDEFERSLFDLALWEGVIMGTAEQIGTANVGTLIDAVGCIETPDELAANGFVVPANTYRISVAWQGDLSTAAPTASACGLGNYEDNQGNPDDATRRLVTLDVTLTNPF